MAETTIEGEDDGYTFYIFPSFVPVEDGKEYIVKWNEEEFSCVATQMEMEEGVYAQIVGNFGFLSGGEDTGEPFIIMSVVQEGVTIAYGLDGNLSAVVSIKGNGVSGELKQLENKYLDLEWLPTFKEIEIVSERTLPHEERIYELNSVFFLLGEKVVVICDGKRYNLPISPGYGNTLEYGWYVGNHSIMDSSRANTGEPFLIFATSANFARAYFADGGEHSISVYLIAEHDTIAKEFLPNGFPYQSEDVLIPRTKAQNFNSNYRAYPLPFVGLSVGKKYIVGWNLEEYECTAKEVSNNGKTIVVLGNWGAWTGGTDTGEPFVIFPADDSSATMAAFKGGENKISLIVSLAEIEVEFAKMDNKFLDTDFINALIDAKLGVIENGTY